MNKWKKVWSLALCLILMFAFSGCAKEAEPEPEPTPTPAPVSSAPEEPEEPRGPYKIAVVQYLEDATLDAVLESFQDRLAEWGVTPDQAVVEVRQAHGKSAEADRICQELVSGETDLIMALGDPAAQAAALAARDSGAKVLFVGPPALADNLGIRYPDSPEGNVTGFTATRYDESQLALALQAAPGLKTVGILTREDTALCAGSMEKLRQLCAEKGVAVKETVIPEAGGDPAAAINALAAEVQAVITPEGGLTTEQCAAVGQALLAAKKPWVAGGMGPVRAGALGCVTVFAEEQGRLAADRAVELMAGKPVSQLPVTALDSKEIVLNQAVLDALHIQLSQETLDAASYISALPGAPAQEVSGVLTPAQ